jgi:S-adenosylmethionine synthetase
MGRTPEVKTKTFTSRYEGEKTIEVELFTWEKLDCVEQLKQRFSI